MSARDDILGRVRQSLRRGPLAGKRVRELEAWIAEPKAHIVPDRAKVSKKEALAAFRARALDVAATVETVSDKADVPEHVAAFLRNHNLPARVRVAAPVQNLDWQGAAIEALSGPAEESDAAAVSLADAGVAETGTLVLRSGPDNPTTLNFLPDNHVVVLPASRLVGAYEELWTAWRERFGEDFLPRAVNWITGPSRTADIELMLLLGAHGPRRLHILIAEDM